MMAIKGLLLSTLVASLAAATPVQAQPAGPAVSTTTCNGRSFVYEELAGYGFVPSDARDKFGDTLGGFGSSAAFDTTSWTLDDAGVYRGVLWAIPDRGWNTEGTLNFQSRIHKFEVAFQPNYTATGQTPSSPNVHLTYLDSILVTDPAGQLLTGLDADADPPYLSFAGFPELPSATYMGDGFGGNGTGGTRVVLDSEGLVLASDGSFWISDEYGPYVYHFSAAGQMIHAIRPPPAFIPQRNGTDSFSANSPPIYDPDFVVVPGNNPTGRDPNQGFEGLTMSPDGETLYVLMQSALDQEGGLKSSHRRNARFVVYDIADPADSVYKAEYVVQLPFYSNQTAVAAQSEIHYLSPTQFLVLARDSGRGHGQSKSTSLYRHVDVFDITNATNIAGDTYDCTTCAVASSAGVLNSSVTPAEYCPWLDFNVNAQLNRFGMHNGGAQDAQLLNEKWESIALAPVNPSAGVCGDGFTKADGEYFLFSLSDNDFITQNGAMNFGRFPYADEGGFNLDNQVLAFKVKLPTH
jgi:hypothetical protein